MAWDASDVMYLPDPASNRVVSFDGAEFRTVVQSASELTLPSAVAFDQEGNLYIANQNPPSLKHIYRIPALPTVGVPDLSPNPIPVGSETTLTASVIAGVAGVAGVAGGEYFIGDDPGEGVGVPMSVDAPNLTATLGSDLEPGVYPISVRARDHNGNWSAVATAYLVVYGPIGEFVTGGGSIYSLPGAYLPDPDLEGRASFGFASKYKKGKTVPDGNTQFHFKAGDLSFHSWNQDWLVVTGGNYAMFKGTGYINNDWTTWYKFRIWAGDGDPDTFRIKIWSEEGGIETVIYDNGTDQPLTGGSIVIHKA